MTSLLSSPSQSQTIIFLFTYTAQKSYTSSKLYWLGFSTFSTFHSAITPLFDFSTTDFGIVIFTSVNHCFISLSYNPLLASNNNGVLVH